MDALCAHYSSFYRLCKAVAHLLRVKDRLLSRDTPCGPISVSELMRAQKLVLSYVQVKTFPREIETLKKSGRVLKSSPIYKLCPVLRDGLILVGGRLSQASIQEEAKHPVILPRKHKVSERIVSEYHDSAHLGTEWTLSLIREKFWIVQCRSLIKQVQRSCVTCKRLYAPPPSQKMADLPAERVSGGCPPFTHVGVDLFGPFLVKQGRSQVKRYGCVYSCFNTRAIHIEVLPSLETDSFINGFIRFVARRGYPAKVWSDNGTNLVGAQNELGKSLKDLDRTKLSGYARRRMVEWVFNPPYASHQGGVWERMIRTIRRVLCALVRPEHRMSHDGLCTVFCEVECIVNSRPITKVSDDIHDDAALSPNHLLLIRGSPSLPWGSVDLADNYRRQWKHVQCVASRFWQRWLKEYLSTLQMRQKWCEKKQNLKQGDLILLMDGNSPRGQWPLGRVLEVTQGRDGLVRSCKVETRGKILVRPITKLVMLEGYTKL